MTARLLRLGTRASPLARWQAEWVAGELRTLGHNVALVPLSTRGDQEQAASLGAIGGQGVFTKELQRALLRDEIDLAVHSLKDLPTDAVDGLELGAVPPREATADVLVSRASASFADLPQGAAIGTGSLRRRAQLWHARPDLKMLDVRGNVDTRLRKLTEGQYDALVLAQAGLMRLGLASHITEILPEAVMLPAVGQGALGIEIRAADAELKAALMPLDDTASHAAVIAERAMLAALRTGCLAPVAAKAEVVAGTLRLRGVVLSGDGSRRMMAQHDGPPGDAAKIGERVAAELLSQGAAELIAAARSS
ncbi:MAG: hydroxymethylbilane synthase [Planctomycetia bacterium 21-64-5]|nr:MAG: hydroxymethylbilane synthase [Planctomycetia bacterium 21-64-5]HQU43167.1 hydroxymethylbilane synthase [Pirellulales bacterium]